jgi:hypothetical protein
MLAVLPLLTPPQDSIPPALDVLCSEQHGSSPEALGEQLHEAPGVHHGARRRGGGVAATVEARAQQRALPVIRYLDGGSADASADRLRAAGINRGAVQLPALWTTGIT